MGNDSFGKTNKCAYEKQPPYHNSLTINKLTINELTINDMSRAESRLSTPATTTAAKGMDWSGCQFIKFWLGHAKESVTDTYSKLADDGDFRKQVAETVGTGFEVPSVLRPTRPKK